MTVSYYLHRPLPAEANEHRAVSRVARLLQRYYGPSKDHYLFVANIEPHDDDRLHQVTQLDGLLLGPELVAILEYKHCFEPVVANEASHLWKCGNDAMLAGSFSNPAFQAENARSAWKVYFQRECFRLFTKTRAYQLKEAWGHLAHFLLFFPLLHPDSELAVAQEDWQRIGDIEQVTDFVQDCKSDRLQLSERECARLVEESLHAQPWDKMTNLMQSVIGYVYIYEPNRPLLREPLYNYDEYTIGRSSSQRYRVQSSLRHISGAHARIEVHDGVVQICDNDSANGTYLNQRRLSRREKLALTPDDLVRLGGRDARACQVWFKPLVPQTGYTSAQTGETEVDTYEP